MKVVKEYDTILGVLFGGWELALVFSLTFALLLSRYPTMLIVGICQAIREFKQAIDDLSFGAGKSLGGIHGKTAHQALTPENQTAELYDPAVLRNKEQNSKNDKLSSVKVVKVVLLSLLICILMAVIIALLVTQ